MVRDSGMKNSQRKRLQGMVNDKFQVIEYIYIFWGFFNFFCIGIFTQNTQYFISFKFVIYESAVF